MHTAASTTSTFTALGIAGVAALMLGACAGSDDGGSMTNPGFVPNGGTPPPAAGITGGGAGTTPINSGGAGTPALQPPVAGTTGGSGGSGGSIAMAGSGGMAGMMAGAPAAGEGGMGGMGGAGGAGGAGGGAGSGESACLDGITDFNAAGPFDYAPKHQGSIKVWVPSVPSGCKVPIIHLANGTGATCSAYQNVLNRFASHGFLTTCYESTQTGAGTQGVMAFEAVLNAHGDMALNSLGSTGHSQGGQAAFTVLQQAEAKFGDSFTYAGLAMEPASGFGAQPPGGSWQSMYSKILSPMFMFSGTADTLVSRSWVTQGYNALSDTVEAYHWSAAGATHIPTPQAETMEVGVPWFRWKLLGDKAACEAFKALTSGSRWSEVASQNVAACN